MRMTLNLASRPFFELRPVLLRLRIAALALCVLALALFLLLRRADIKAAQAQTAVQHWTVATQALQQEWQRDQSLMRQPSNAATLDRSQFLNQIFLQKSFSWTTALMDLELVLPQGVQVMSINPQMAKDGHVMMRLRVSGPRDKVIDLVTNLEKSAHFLEPLVAGETADIQEEGRAGFRPTMSESTDVNVDILAEFNPGDLAWTDVTAEEIKSGTHATQHEQTHVPAGDAIQSRRVPGNRRVHSRPSADRSTQ